MSRLRVISGWARYRGFMVLLFLVAVGFMLYGRILHAPFQFDDYRMIKENWTIRSLDNFQHIWEQIDYPKLCFLTFLSFAVNYHFGGYNPFGYHLVNLLLHIAVTFLLYVFIRQIFRSPYMRDKELSRWGTSVALFSSLLYMSHPMQTQAVTYIWSRTEILSAFLGLLSLTTYMAGRNRKKSLLIFLSVMLFVVAVFARGNMVVWPLLISLLEVSFYGLNLNKIRWLFRHHALRMCALSGSLLLALLFFIRQVAFWNLRWFLTEPIYSRWEYLLTQLRVVIMYIRLAFIPYPQNLDYFFLPSRSLFDPKTFLSFLAIVIVLVLSTRLFLRRRLAAFGIFWFFISLIPVSTILVLSVVISESRLYFPLVGFCLFVTVTVFRLIPRPRLRKCFLIALIIIFGLLTVKRNELWRSSIALWEDTASKSPQHGRVNTILSMLYIQEGRLQEAAELLERTITLYPTYVRAYNNLGVVYMQAGADDKAVALFEKILEMDSEYLFAYLNLGRLYLAKKAYWNSKHILKQSIVFCGPSEGAFLLLAENSMTRREADPNLLDQQAISYLKEAIKLNPRSQTAYAKLTQLYLVRKEYDRALWTAQQWGKFCSDDHVAYLFKGEIYKALADIPSAIQAYKKAVAINPQDPVAYGALGKIYFSLKQFDQAEFYYKEHTQRTSALGKPSGGRAALEPAEGR